MVPTRIQPVEILHGYRPISGLGSRFVPQLLVYPQRVGQHIFAPHPGRAVCFMLGECFIQQYSSWPADTPGSLVPILSLFSIFVLTAVTCLSFSAMYHILLNHSQYVERFLLKTGYVGCGDFHTGRFFLGVYMVFYCEPLPRNIYWSMVS